MDVIIDNEQFHTARSVAGNLADTMTPRPPGPLATLRTPPNEDTRSRIPLKPNPPVCSGCNPTPSSDMRTTI